MTNRNRRIRNLRPALGKWSLLIGLVFILGPAAACVDDPEHVVVKIAQRHVEKEEEAEVEVEAEVEAEAVEAPVEEVKGE